MNIEPLAGQYLVAVYRGEIALKTADKKVIHDWAVKTMDEFMALGECEAIINNARTSDVAVFDRFYGADFAARLRTDATRRIGDVTGYAITQGGEQALCVDVPVNGGIKSYCALETGPLARYNGNDLFIELTAYSATPDESKFATS